MRIRDIEALISATENAITKVNQMNKKYPQKYYNTAYEVCDTVITKWYSSYSPIIYDRVGSLYDMFKVRINGTKLLVDIDGEGLSGLSEYLYNLTFVEGYHGGAKSGTSYYRSPQGTKLMAFPHPQPGVPYWKTPIPEFYRWGRPAVRSFSPYYKIRETLDKRLGLIDKERQKEYDAIVEKIRKIINRF